MHCGYTDITRKKEHVILQFKMLQHQICMNRWNLNNYLIDFKLSCLDTIEARNAYVFKNDI